MTRAENDGLEAIRDTEGGQTGTGLVEKLPTQLIISGGRSSGQQHDGCSIQPTEQGHDGLEAIRDREGSHTGTAEKIECRCTG